MANNIDWGKIYCFTEWGQETKTIIESIPAFSAPSCFTSPKTGNQIDTLALTVDLTSFTVDSTTTKISQTTI
tara:strand:- start:385 stop:600 length:216 start_codon:yes stop_codon:yes gene_type:complete